MATSPYKKQFEEFKKALPAKLLEHAQKNGLDLCDEGLEGFFKDIGVEWDRPRQEFRVSLSFRMHLPAQSDRYDETSLADNGEEELDTFLYEIEKAMCKASKHYVSGSIEQEEVYAY